MNEIEILQKIKLCLQKADMAYQINVAFDPDEDGDCYFKEGLFYINNIKTKYTASDIISNNEMSLLKNSTEKIICQAALKRYNKINNILMK